LQDKLIKISERYAQLEENNFELQQKLNLVSQGTPRIPEVRGKSPAKSTSGGTVDNRSPLLKSETEKSKALSPQTAVGKSSPTGAPTRTLSLDTTKAAVTLGANKSTAQDNALSKAETENDDLGMHIKSSAESEVEGRPRSESSSSATSSTSTPSTKSKRKSILKSTVKFFMGMTKSTNNSREKEQLESTSYDTGVSMEE